jgi:uncharacterized SAM-binding protein YcdF (DUF218 family)
MLFTISKIFGILSEPANVLVLLLVLGVLGVWFGWRRARGLVAAVTFVFLAVTVLPVGDWAIAPLEDRFPQPPMPARVDGIILLGGAVSLPITRAHGQVALNRHAERITETMALARTYPDARVLISGGDPGMVPGGPTEAAAMRSLLVSFGLDEGRMLLEQRSRNTYENAVDSKALADPRPGQTWLLVTSSFHMPRAVGCFRAAGFDVLPYPVDYQIGHRPLVDFNLRAQLDLLDLAWHEWAGLVAYRVLGRTDSVFPGPAPISASSAR